MEDRRIAGFFKRGLQVLAALFLVFFGPMISGQGCTDLGKFVQETQREYKLKQQMKLAEDELKKGNLQSAQTLFEWIQRESERPVLQERALFFSGVSRLLDGRDPERWERAQSVFLEVSERYPEGEFAQVSEYLAAALSDVVSTLEVLHRENRAMQQTMDQERSHAREMEGLVEEQKKQLTEKAGEIKTLKHSLHRKTKEVRSLRLKMKKLEEIHKEIKEKRKGLT
jgi:septal ring factor EnvC (AmiA/AmiB activator)